MHLNPSGPIPATPPPFCRAPTLSQPGCRQQWVRPSPNAPTTPELRSRSYVARLEHPPTHRQHSTLRGHAAECVRGRYVTNGGEMPMTSRVRPLLALLEEEPVGPTLDIVGRYGPELQMRVSPKGNTAYTENPGHEIAAFFAAQRLRRCGGQELRVSVQYLPSIKTRRGIRRRCSSLFPIGVTGWFHG